MGLIKAAVSSVGGVLKDSWLETIEPGQMTDQTVMVSGVKVRKGKGSNNGDDNIVSNGSVIHVYPNMMMLLMDCGKVVDYSAEEGYYQVSMSSAPSLFNGELSETVKDTWERFKFGGAASSTQKVYYINLQEIKGIKFGTKNPVNYYDQKYDAELFLRAHGTYSIKITDPLKFFNEAVPRNASRCDFSDISAQYIDEFMDALQSAINQLSADGISISNVTSKSRELSKYMSQTLDADWNELRGMEVCSVGIGSISYDDESKKLINMRNQGAMLKDAAIREGYVQGNIAEGLKAAGSNPNGAAQAFMGMGMGMNAAGGFMSAASQTNAQQMQAQQAAQAQAQAAQAQAANTWKCQCGAENTGNFCNNCGSKKPAPAGQWQCPCGTVNTGNFCSNCGKKNPNAAWKCSCGAENTGNFCNNCGAKRP